MENRILLYSKKS